MPLATPDDVAAYGYDVETVSPLVKRAETRVRGFLKPRASAQAVLAGTVRSEELVELVVTIAARMASTNPKVSSGITSEQAGALQVSFGSQAYKGTTGLTDDEKQRLIELFPARAKTVDLVQ